MSQKQKLSELDLVTRVLANLGVRNVKKWSNGKLKDTCVGFIRKKLPVADIDVIIFRYNFITLCEDSSVRGVAKYLGITEGKVRAIEKRSIKRLQEPDCFGYFVKAFGSGRAIGCEILRLREKIEAIEKDNDVDLIFPEHDLLAILKHTEAVFAVYKKYFPES